MIRRKILCGFKAWDTITPGLSQMLNRGACHDTAASMDGRPTRETHLRSAVGPFHSLQCILLPSGAAVGAAHRDAEGVGGAFAAGDD